mmetsp:Transcript_84243/g.192106  ORF Transcript_84243/g.192106 Transcript_84243/m.192106 type:complete len:434 (-) Transcript_84243:239-1540(-)
MCGPTGMEVDSGRVAPAERPVADLASSPIGNSKAFEISIRNQYNKLYLSRLQALTPLALQAGAKKWPTVPAEHVHSSLSELRVRGPGSVGIAAGCLCKKVAKKKSVLDGLDNFEALPNLVNQDDCYVSEEDEVALEDASFRVALGKSGEFWTNFTAGMVVAVHARVDAAGKFQILDACLPGYAPPSPPAAGQGRRLLALVSGLQPGRGMATPQALLALLEFVTGMKESQRDVAASIAQVIVAGGIQMETEDEDQGEASLDQADNILASMAASVPVVIMPGATDCATNQSLPQVPLGSVCLPFAAKAGAKGVSNPCAIEVAGCKLLGAAGQPVSSVVQFTSLERHVDALRTCLEARLMAPTAPTELTIAPHAEDPMIIADSQIPRVMFSGNHPTFEAEERGGVVFVCVPAFHQRPAVVLVDLDTLVAEEVLVQV